MPGAARWSVASATLHRVRQGSTSIEFINNNSVWIIGILVFGAGGMFAWEHRRSWKVVASIVLVLFVLSAGYWTARTGSSDVASIAEVDAMLASGSPVVLQLYSDTCTLCLIAKRSVDGMEAELEGLAEVVRVSANDPIGRAVSRRYGLGYVPTFIVFSTDGREVHRETGSPDVERIKRAALAPG